MYACVCTLTGKSARINRIKVEVFLASIYFPFLGFPSGENAAVLVCQTRNIFK